MNRTPLFVFLFLFAFCSFSQNVFIKRDNKLVGLDQLKNLKIHHYVTSGAKDSVYIITEIDSLSKSGDTLIVDPYTVEEFHYHDTTVETGVQKLYKESSIALIKIPINQIDKLVGKKRSISRPLSWLSTIAFLGIATSIPLRLSNSDNQAIGNTVFIVAAPVLIVSWTLQATVAKKRYHFDKSRTDKKTWIFN